MSTCHSISLKSWKALAWIEYQKAFSQQYLISYHVWPKNMIPSWPHMRKLKSVGVAEKHCFHHRVLHGEHANEAQLDGPWTTRRPGVLNDTDQSRKRICDNEWLSWISESPPFYCRLPPPPKMWTITLHGNPWNKQDIYFFMPSLLSLFRGMADVQLTNSAR